MRYQASQTQSLSTPDDDDDATLDVAALVAGQKSDVPESVPYKSPTLVLLRILWRYFNPKANGFHKGMIVLAILAVIAWPIGTAFSAATRSISPLDTAITAAGLGALLGSILFWRSMRRDAVDTYCRTHLALMAAGVLSMAGLLPQAMLINAIAPMAVAYGGASFVILICSAWFVPIKQIISIPEVGEGAET